MPITKNTSKEAIIHDFVHSDDSRFDKDSVKQRIKRALGAYRGMHEADGDGFNGAGWHWMAPDKAAIRTAKKSDLQRSDNIGEGYYIAYLDHMGKEVKRHSQTPHPAPRNTKKKVKEEVELQELKKSTLGSYVKKSAEDRANLKTLKTAAWQENDADSADYWENKEKNREKGINRAVNKLTKEDTELEESHRIGDTVSFHPGQNANQTSRALSGKIINIAKNGDHIIQSDRSDMPYTVNKSKIIKNYRLASMKEAIDPETLHNKIKAALEKNNMKILPPISREEQKKRSDERAAKGPVKYPTAGAKHVPLGGKDEPVVNGRAYWGEEVELEEGRPSQQHPIEGHPYHSKSNDELHYIIKDAGAAAKAQKGMSSEGKYLDQQNDASTVLGFRQRATAVKGGSLPDWYVKKYLSKNVKEEVEINEISSDLAKRYFDKALKVMHKRVDSITNPKKEKSVRKINVQHKKHGINQYGIPTDYNPNAESIATHAEIERLGQGLQNAKKRIKEEIELDEALKLHTPESLAKQNAKNKAALVKKFGENFQKKPKKPIEGMPKLNQAQATESVEYVKEGTIDFKSFAKRQAAENKARMAKEREEKAASKKAWDTKYNKKEPKKIDTSDHKLHKALERDLGGSFEHFESEPKHHVTKEGHAAAHLTVTHSYTHKDLGMHPGEMEDTAETYRVTAVHKGGGKYDIHHRSGNPMHEETQLNEGWELYAEDKSKGYTCHHIPMSKAKAGEPRFKHTLNGKTIISHSKYYPDEFKAKMNEETDVQEQAKWRQQTNRPTGPGLGKTFVKTVADYGNRTIKEPIGREGLDQDSEPIGDMDRLQDRKDSKLNLSTKGLKLTKKNAQNNLKYNIKQHLVKLSQTPKANLPEEIELDETGGLNMALLNKSQKSDAEHNALVATVARHKLKQVEKSGKKKSQDFYNILVRKANLVKEQTLEEGWVDHISSIQLHHHGKEGYGVTVTANGKKSTQHHDSYADASKHASELHNATGKEIKIHDMTEETNLDEGLGGGLSRDEVKMRKQQGFVKAADFFKQHEEKSSSELKKIIADRLKKFSGKTLIQKKNK